MNIVGLFTLNSSQYQWRPIHSTVNNCEENSVPRTQDRFPFPVWFQSWLCSSLNLNALVAKPVQYLQTSHQSRSRVIILRSDCSNSFSYLCITSCQSLVLSSTSTPPHTAHLLTIDTAVIPRWNEFIMERILSYSGNYSLALYLPVLSGGWQFCLYCLTGLRWSAPYIVMVTIQPLNYSLYWQVSTQCWLFTADVWLRLYSLTWQGYLARAQIVCFFTN